MGKIIGIDLGTRNSVAAVIEGGEPVIITNDMGGRTFYSIVAVNPKDGARLVGQTAKRQAIVNPKNTVFSVKRFMGRKLDEPEIQRAIANIPYEVQRATNGDVRVVMNGRQYAPPEISAMILQKIKTDAEAFLGQTVSQAVITVPAYFNDSQRQATKDAGKIAGLEVIRIINEPTASALAYGLGKDADETIAVYDFGGGTFGISILEIGDGVFEVRATNGDTFLGGDDFDTKIVEWAADQFQREHGIDLRQDQQALQRLRDAAENAKIALSTTMQAELSLPFITADVTGPKHLKLLLNRTVLERLTRDLIERSLDSCRRVMQDAGLEKSEVTQVVLVGGMTRMPAVRNAVRGFFGKVPHKGVNPDEVVALGAAIQAGVLNGDVRDVLLLDVIPLTLSIETLGGVATPLIERNSTLPTFKNQVFSTAADNQTQVEIHITQGERPLANDNISLGRFILDGLPPAPRGVPQIEVTFDITPDGIFNVTAKDQATGRGQSMRIIPSSGLTEAEINQMVGEIQQYYAEDKARRQAMERRNRVDSVVYSAEKYINDNAHRLSRGTQIMIQQKIDRVRAGLPHRDTSQFQASVELQAILRLQKGIEAMRSILDGGDIALIKVAVNKLRIVLQEVDATL